jgi:phage-related protein
MPTFTWVPAYEPQRTVKAGVITTQFGDGYSQRVSQGLNSVAESWQLTFTRLKTEVAQIEAFLRARSGVESFEWLTPDGVTRKFIAPEWRTSVMSLSVNQLQVSFEQVFE